MAMKRYSALTRDQKLLRHHPKQFLSYSGHPVFWGLVGDYTSAGNKVSIFQVSPRRIRGKKFTIDIRRLLFQPSICSTCDCCYRDCPMNIISTYFGWCLWCNGYRRRKWTRRHVFKSWTRLIAFHIALTPLGKVWIQLFSLQLWVNSRIVWVLQPWWGN